MRHVLKPLGLLLLLLIAQQGAVVHELSHYSAAGNYAPAAGNSVLSEGAAADSTCALCPAFAQVVTPAFSHSFHIPQLVRAAPEVSSDLQIAAIDAAVPRPRSRGPPSSS